MAMSFSLFLDMMFSIFNVAATMAKEILWVLLNYGYLGVLHSTNSRSDSDHNTRTSGNNGNVPVAIPV